MKRWDIFCRVIDNYGDIGICWRLARQLTHEHGQQVRLWVDDLASLRPLCPETDIEARTQSLDGVDVSHWPAHFPDTAPTDVVIEAFGCDLPDRYIDAMAVAARKPVWINLEYLSAEPWTEGCHGMASPHPRLPLTKYFFFPGFTPATGGLLREHDLIRRRDAFMPQEFLASLKITVPQDALTVSLFSYDTAPVGRMLHAWEGSSKPVLCLLPAGKPLIPTAAYFGMPTLIPGDRVQRGALTLQVLPFLRQEDYDRLLWSCDVNFVRGEDSFVRAQWAARPLIWQPYVQEEESHLLKLAAFLDRYTAPLERVAANVLHGFHQGWNNHGPLDWEALLDSQQTLSSHARGWSDTLAAQPDLASNLVIFCKNRV